MAVNAIAPKHKRARQSCNVCRSRKIRCVVQPGNSTCDGCAALGRECHYSSKSRKPGRPNRYVKLQMRHVFCSIASRHAKVSSPANERHHTVTETSQPRHIPTLQESTISIITPQSQPIRSETLDSASSTRDAELIVDLPWWSSASPNVASNVSAPQPASPIMGSNVSAPQQSAPPVVRPYHFSTHR